MVKYNPKTWFDLIFHSYSRQIMKILFPALLMMGIFTALITYFLQYYYQISFKSTTAVHSLLGIVLGLILVFRMNSAYDRWWEGRKLWGALVNNTRTLAIKLNAFLPKDSESRIFFKDMIPNFAFALKEHLREGVRIEELQSKDENFSTTIQLKTHKPNYISSLMYEKITDHFHKGDFTGEQVLVLDKEFKEFTDIMGACERIKNTPIPYSFSMFIKKFIFTYIITLPFAFMSDFDFWTVPIVLFLFFILLSIELISEEIEDPFGQDTNDLPTDAMSEKIQMNVKEIFNLKD